MPVKAGQIVIDITAGTSKFVQDMEVAKGKIREFGKEAHSSVTGVQAVSGALRVMEGNVTNNLRAAERFLANTLHLGPALQAAFPVVGALAFGGVIGEMGVKVRNFFKELSEGPGKASDAFRALNAPLKTTNDELLVANDRLENDIAKLEGKRQNNLKLALDEARVAADKLADSLDKSLTSLHKALEENSHGSAMAGANGNPTNPLGTLRVQQAIEASDIEARYQGSLKLANSDLERAIALRQKNLDLQKLSNEMEERTAELRQRGVRDFFVEMQGQSQSAGNILYDSMKSALDKSSGELAKLATGQKTSFGKTFQSVGQGMVQQSVKSMAQFGLGKLAGVFGIHGGSGKPDGSAGNPFHVISAGGGLPSLPGIPASGTTSNAMSGLMKSISGGIGGFFSKIFSAGGGGISFMADGGDADPGKIYGVAEAGEAEIVSPKSSARITPLSKAGLGGNYTYHIDARGADLGAENRVMRAIDFAHSSAVKNGVQASAERTKRTPKRSS